MTVLVACLNKEVIAKPSVVTHVSKTSTEKAETGVLQV